MRVIPDTEPALGDSQTTGCFEVVGLIVAAVDNADSSRTGQILYLSTMLGTESSSCRL